MRGLFDTGNEDFSRYLSEYLKQAQGVQTGQIQPTQLPEYKYLSSDLTSQLPKMLAAFQAEMTNKGVEGGAFTKGLSDINENYTKGLLGAERGAFEGATSKGIDVAKILGAFKEEDLNRFMAAYNAQKQIDTQRDIAKMSGITSGANTGISTGGNIASNAGCCFIFIEGNSLTENVRTLRDEMFPKGGIVENGYRRMARWLVPRMARNWLVKKIVQWIMLNPICLVADNYYGQNSYGWAFRPIGHFWKKVWERLGK